MWCKRSNIQSHRKPPTVCPTQPNHSLVLVSRRGQITPFFWKLILSIPDNTGFQSISWKECDRYFLTAKPPNLATKTINWGQREINSCIKLFLGAKFIQEYAQNSLGKIILRQTQTSGISVSSCLNHFILIPNGCIDYSGKNVTVIFLTVTFSEFFAAKSAPAITPILSILCNYYAFKP